jgi:peroxiredoxin
MLSEQYGSRGVEVLVIDASNRRELTEEMVAEASLTVPVLLDDQDISGEAYGVFATPTTFVVDTAGRIIFKHIGYGPGMEGMLQREVALLLERQAT